jgi:hypothetical protein
MTPTIPIKFENQVAKIGWDASTGILHFEWKLFATGELFHEALEHNIQLAQQLHATKQLTNTTHAGAFKSEDQQWLIDNYTPRMRQAGIKYMALLVPDNVVANMSQKRVVQSVHQDSKNQTGFAKPFNSASEALDWLKSNQ